MTTISTAPGTHKSRSLDTRVAELEAQLAEILSPSTSEPEPPTGPSTVEAHAAQRSSFAGGVRVVTTPAPKIEPGLMPPDPGVLVSVSSLDGFSQMIRVLAGQRFEPGPVADGVENAARMIPGLLVERIPTSEGTTSA